ncbi:ABC-type cobalt transport system, permease component [Propionibacterium ruminifibrarum]|uniref:ABC-type cobalt transport system, permease component n=1 Tax=Propionibacterium ruminifibrarum TaxID=1962131 RepID=A0A375HZS8_9ACTN|nr:ECF transporter S component [Propionibacterium ruminifibrarum]SPF68002.1 ABC-type cobalt transport system, permease component [Propionibacterium ruminifibrarum]
MSSSSSAADQTRPARTGRHGWRVVDIVVAAVLAVAVGLIFWLWNAAGGAWYGAMSALTPGLGGLATGIWYLGGPLGGQVIRKPGAAVFVELVAALVSTAIGNQWGITTLTSGLFQGLGAGLVFALFRYRVWSLPVTMLAGAGAGVGAWLNELFIGTTPNITLGLAYNAIYLVTNIISGLLLAGLLAWVITRALARTGALNRFASGRAA